jgi:hypothetical protein
MAYRNKVLVPIEQQLLSSDREFESDSSESIVETPPL